MHGSAGPAAGLAAGPLDGALRRCGATMQERGGRLVAARFESVGGEVAACLSTVGLADRSGRATLELRGSPGAVEEALADLDWIRERAWWSRPAPTRAIVRCEAGAAAACAAALQRSPDASVRDCSTDYAAIGVIGPRAEELLELAGAGSGTLVLRESADCFEALVEAERGPPTWERLLEAGAPLHAACVGADALVQLAASKRLDARGAAATGRGGGDGG